ncbi:MAG: glycoside hydrolase family 32 protein [Cyclobacteriaceae bacterium]
MIFNEPHRPQLHFSPEANWMNDPNGMVFHNGEYHLFYQYYPDSTVWGPMHWGHAVSKDMIHWEHLPVALYPDSLGLIFSGSAVVDIDNTSGFGTKENPPMVAIYTQHLTEAEKAGRTDYQTQSIAYSLDNGRSWTKYEGNPVIGNPGKKDFRDPKVLWHSASSQWIMILAVLDHVEIFGSPDLKSWTLLSEFGAAEGSHGGVWECPDLFPFTANDQKKWVMLVSLNNGSPNGGSGTQYFVGDFDGKQFINDNSPETILWIDHGRDNYAGITWANVPASDGRRLFIGWMSNWNYAQVVPTSPWRSAMTLPREFNLIETNNGLRLTSTFVKEIERLYQGKKEYTRLTAGSTDLSSEHTRESTYQIRMSTAGKALSDFSFVLSNSKNQSLTLGFDAASNQYYIDRTQSQQNEFSKDFPGKHTVPRETHSPIHNLVAVIDRSSIELIADDGLSVLTEIFFPDEPFSRLKLTTAGSIDSVEVTELKRIWDK